MNSTIGIDVSKDKLDAYWLLKREHRPFFNDRKGVQVLTLWAREARIERVILEATGPCHRIWSRTGSALRGPTRVKPAVSARGGQLAKIDRVDAGMLAKMDALLALKADLSKSEALHDFIQLTTARQALIKEPTAAKARLAATTHKLLSRQIKGRSKDV